MCAELWRLTAGNVQLWQPAIHGVPTVPGRGYNRSFGAYLQILLTFTGFHDPYAKGLVGEDEQPGPEIDFNQPVFPVVRVHSRERCRSERSAPWSEVRAGQ
jgi:hypothetical protein